MEREPLSSSANHIMKLTKSYESKITQFLDALNRARDGIAEAGRILVELVESNENTYEIIMKRCPGVTLEFLETLERVGHGRLDHRLLCNPSWAAMRATRTALPIEAQKQLVDGYVQVAVKNNGGVVVKPKRMDELTRHEASRLIADDHLRTPDEQIKIMRDREVVKAATSMRYMILDGKVTFLERVTLTWAELTELANKIAPKASELQGAMMSNQVRV